MKKAIFFLALTLIVGESIAQNLSQYEQKRYDLAAQTATEIVMEVPELAITLGMSVKKTDFTNKYEEMDFFEGLIQSVGVFAVYNSNADYQSYKVKEIYKTWIEQRRVIDKTKTKADEQRENERKKKTWHSSLCLPLLLHCSSYSKSMLTKGEASDYTAKI